MTPSTLPVLPDGWRWQLTDNDKNECTGSHYAEVDAVEARIWHEDDVLLVLTRTGDFGHWGADGLRKWAIQGFCPEGLMEWEHFETLSDVAHRLAAPKG